MLQNALEARVPPQTSLGELTTLPQAPSRDGLRAFGAPNSLFLSPSYSSSPNLFPKFSIHRIAIGSKQPQTPPLDTLCLVSVPSGPQLYGPPYLFFGNSTTAYTCIRVYNQPITVNGVGHLLRWLDCAHKYTRFTMKQKQGMEGGEITSEFEYSRPPLIPVLYYVS